MDASISGCPSASNRTLHALRRLFLNMTTNFYAPPSALRGGHVTLPEDEAHHARSVLRVRPGDEMTVVDGQGGWHRVRVDHSTEGQVVGSILETRRGVGEPTVHVTVGMALLKKRRRFETFVEKAVELGVRHIVPLRTAHTERDTLRRERVRNVMIAAVKQCRRSWLPSLEPPQPLGALLEAATAEARFVCHGVDEGTPLSAALSGRDGKPSVLVLVGPEGGFSEGEVEKAIDAGCRPVSLGERRLRAETAGIVAVDAAVRDGRRSESSDP